MRFLPQAIISAMIPTDAHPPSLRVFLGERLVFSSNGRWLHPLFELEEQLAVSAYPRGELLASDRIVGKAAALLIARLGIRRVRAETLSRLGEGVLHARGIEYSYGTLVDRIACATEALLSEVDDLESAYRLLARRAGRPLPGDGAMGRGLPVFR